MPRMNEPEPTGEPSPYARLIFTYSLLALYGLSSALVGLATIDVVAGEEWGLAWPVLIFFTATLSLIALLRARATNKHALELTATLALVSLLLSYTLFIIIRTFFDGVVTRLPIGLLPVIVSVGPYFRLARISRGTVRR